MVIVPFLVGLYSTWERGENRKLLHQTKEFPGKKIV